MTAESKPGPINTWRAVCPTLNEMVWDQLKNIHTRLHLADMVFGFLRVNRDWRAGTHEQDWIYATRLWRSICKLRGRPAMIMTDEAGHHLPGAPKTIGMSVPKKASTDIISTWWVMAGNAPGCDVTNNATVINVITEKVAGAAVLRAFYRNTLTNDDWRRVLRLPLIHELPADARDFIAKQVSIIDAADSKE